MVIKKSAIFILIFLVIGFLGGCSKQLTPPPGMEGTTSITEGGTGSGMGESSFSGEGSGAGGESEGFGFMEEGSVGENESFAGSGGSGFESESGAGGGSGSGPGSFGSGSGLESGSGDFGEMPGTGATGTFEAGPFAGSGGTGGPGGMGGGPGGMGGGPGGMGGGAGGFGSEGMEEARLLPFQSTSDLSDIHFAFDRHDLDNNSKSTLKMNAEWLKQNPGIRVEIQGHCDERGTNNYNLGLGERRANSTRKYLEALGVEPNRLYTVSYGEEKPFCMESSENCWWENRRAHFLVSR